TDTTFSLQGVTPNELALMHFGPGATRTAREVWSELDRPEFANIAARSFLVQGFFDDALATEELIDAYAEPLSSGTSEAFIQFFDGLNVELAPDAVAARRVRFQGFGKPAAIIFGADDEFFDATVIPPMFASDFSVPADRTTIVPSAGHYLQEENPSAYSAAVVAFLEDL
ncbi:MAG: alpha/beta hydrolase, partial [Myxococcota bacterium]